MIVIPDTPAGLAFLTLLDEIASRVDVEHSSTAAVDQTAAAHEDRAA